MIPKTKVAVKITDKNRQKAIDLLLEYGQESNIADSAEGFLIITRKPYQEKASVGEVVPEVPWGFEVIKLNKLREILKAEAAEAKEEVEGKWYAAHRDGRVSLLFFCTRVKNNLLQGFGFNEERWLGGAEYGWCNPWDIGGSITKATPQEVEAALIEEAKRRGFDYDDFVFEDLTNILWANYDSDIVGKEEKALFNNGKWNEPFDKFAELKEAHKNGAVIQMLAKYNSKWRDVKSECDYWLPNYEYRIKPEEGEDPYLWGNKIVSEPRDGAADNVFDKISGSIADLLKYKNEKYGNSALHPLKVFEGKAKVGQRLDDKLARIKNSTELKKNDVADLIGYLTLVCVENNWTDFSEFKD